MGSMMLRPPLFSCRHVKLPGMLTRAGPAAGMPHKHPKALPTTASTATTPTAAGTPAASAAPERRSWFRRDRRAGADLGPAAGGVGAGTAAGAYAGARLYLWKDLSLCLTCLPMHASCGSFLSYADAR